MWVEVGSTRVRTRRGVKSVELSVDSVTWVPGTLNTIYWVATLDTSGLPNGTNTLYADRLAVVLAHERQRRRLVRRRARAGLTNLRTT